MAEAPKKVHVSESSLGPAAGRGLFTSCNLPEGHEILALSDPFVALPDNANLHRVCEQCFEWVDKPDEPGEELGDSVASYLQKQPGTSLKACLGCRTVYYCGKVVFFPGALFSFVP